MGTVADSKVIIAFVKDPCTGSTVRLDGILVIACEIQRIK